MLNGANRWLLAFASLFISSSVVAQEPSGGQPDWLSQAKIAAQLEGISVGEAVRRARLQNLAIEQGERFASYPDFAGSWIERRGNSFRVVFAFKGNAQKPISNPDLAAASQTAAVSYSYREIDAERVRLSQALAALAITASFAARVKENDLVVYPSDAGKVRSLLAAGQLTVAPFVKIENGPLLVHDQALVYGGGPTTGSYVDANGATKPEYCTAAFTVTTGGTGSGGTRGISTAGHCTPPRAQMDTHNGLPIGTRQGYQLGGGLDAAWFNNSTNTYTNRVSYQGSYYTITSWSAPYPNPPKDTVICVIKRDGTQPCAYVYNNNIYIDTQDNGPYILMDRIATVDTDSGAPWLYGSVAYGINKGTTCAGVCGSLYSPAASLTRIGINVLITP